MDQHRRRQDLTSVRVRNQGGTFTASYHVPALPATSGSVSLRVQARDSAGDSVSQTVPGAYSITG